jgi:hypothetical protein
MSSINPLDVYDAWLGIPPEECDAEGPHHYQLLGLRVFEKDAKAIDAAARQRVATLSQYAAGQYPSLAQRLMAEVESAAACLCDPGQKARYDRALALGERLVSAPAQQAVYAAPTASAAESLIEAPPAALAYVQGLLQPVAEAEDIEYGLQPIEQPAPHEEYVSAAAPAPRIRRSRGWGLSMPALMTVLGGIVGLLGGYFIVYYLLGEDLLRMLPAREAILRLSW